MKVQVTQEHIDKSYKADKNISLAGRCPVALAIQEALNNPNIKTGWTEFEDGDGKVIGTIKGATSFISAYDKDEKVSPIEIEITLK